jgi:hypothetical protein
MGGRRNQDLDIQTWFESGMGNPLPPQNSLRCFYISATAKFFDMLNEEFSDRKERNRIPPYFLPLNWPGPNLNLKLESLSLPFLCSVCVGRHGLTSIWITIHSVAFRIHFHKRSKQVTHPTTSDMWTKD